MTEPRYTAACSICRAELQGTLAQLKAALKLHCAFAVKKHEGAVLVDVIAEDAADGDHKAIHR